MPKLLLVEDEKHIREGLIELFENQEFDVTCAECGRSALDALAEDAFDIVLLDIMLPRITGLEVLKHARERSMTTPVLMLTALGTEDDIVRGLEAGADDYVTKPFGVSELLARVKGLLRRAPTESEVPRTFAIDGVHFDTDALFCKRGEQSVQFTAREAHFLRFLFERRHRVVTRDELLVGVWGYNDGGVITRTIDVHVAGLRNKLKEIDAHKLLETVRGRGYRLASEGERA